MGADLFVDPEALEAAVEGADSAAEGLGEAARLFLEARDHMQQALSVRLFPDVRHKAATFSRQWSWEMREISVELGEYGRVIRAVAAAYREHETALTAAVEGALEELGRRAGS